MLLNKMKFLKIKYYVDDDEVKCSSDYYVMLSLDDLNLDQEDLKSKKTLDYLKTIVLRLARINGHTSKYTEVTIENLEIVEYELKTVVNKEDEEDE